MGSKTIHIVPLNPWLTCMTAAVWISRKQGHEVFIADMYGMAAKDVHMERLLQETAADSDIQVQTAEEWMFDDILTISRMEQIFGTPPGIVFAAADSLTHCLQGAVLAIRLGWGFYPLTRQSISPEDVLFFAGIEKVFLGTAEELLPLQLMPDACPAVLSGYDDIYRFMQSHLLPVDYLVTVNTADLWMETGSGYAAGVSMNSLMLTAFRDVFLYDADTAACDPVQLEQEVNRQVSALGLSVSYHCIMASPAAIPFIYGEILELETCAEEPVRDIYIQGQDKMFFQCAGGRMFQKTTSGLSWQLYSTRKQSFPSTFAGHGKDVLMVCTPSTQKGIIFDSDEPLLKAKLNPLLQNAGCRTKVLQKKDATKANVLSALQEADVFLYSGHGSPESLNTGEDFLLAGDVPELPPLVVYASACSTTYCRPYFISFDEGLSWSDTAIPVEDQIALSMLDKGAVAFIGSATSADYQFTTSIYGLFLEALLLDGKSVGEALNETRNFVITQASMLRQKSPEYYKVSMESISNIIHQQILLGDPAYIPYPLEDPVANSQEKVTIAEDGAWLIELNIPAASWHEAKITTHGEAVDYYHSHELTVISPDGKGFVTWGDFYNLLPDEQGIASRSFMSVFARLSCDLPHAMHIEALQLQEVIGSEECLCCRDELNSDIDVTESFLRYRLPYMMLVPASIDGKDGWPYATETVDGNVRIHWLMPVLVINTEEGKIVRAEKISFRMHLCPAKKIHGKMSTENAESMEGYLIAALMDAVTEKHGATTIELAHAITASDGSFDLLCPASAEVIMLKGQFPARKLMGMLETMEGRLSLSDINTDICFSVVNMKKTCINFHVVDSRHAQGVEGAFIRVWRGILDPNGYYLRECCCLEMWSDKQGYCSGKLPAGEYLVFIAAGSDGKRYKTKQIQLKVDEQEQLDEVFVLDEAAIVRGKISFADKRPPYPTVMIRSMPEKKEVLASCQVDGDGYFECQVIAGQSFCITMNKEGWNSICDDAEGKGYCLPKQGILDKEYLFSKNS